MTAQSTFLRFRSWPRCITACSLARRPRSTASGHCIVQRPKQMFRPHLGFFPAPARGRPAVGADSIGSDDSTNSLLRLLVEREPQPAKQALRLVKRIATEPLVLHLVKIRVPRRELFDALEKRERQSLPERAIVLDPYAGFIAVSERCGDVVRIPPNQQQPSPWKPFKIKRQQDTQPRVLDAPRSAPVITPLHVVHPPVVVHNPADRFAVPHHLVHR